MGLVYLKTKEEMRHRKYFLKSLVAMIIVKKKNFLNSRECNAREFHNKLKLKNNTSQNRNSQAKVY